MPGDLMIIDLNPVIRQYKGDITRTFCVGAPTAAQQSMHDTIVRALDRAMKVGRPGARGREVDAALRELLVGAGYGPWLTTHFGHGLGLQHLERPYIIPAEEMRLEEGMVIALEPGVYAPDGMGMRVEDNYVVTPAGLEPLSHYPRDLGVTSS
jgi:Xaa-Pro aminopeptidase